MKLGRDTKPATEAAARAKRKRRKEKQEEIRELCLPSLCKKLPKCDICDAPDIRKCASLKKLVDELNSYDYLTLRGKTKNWDVTMVKNLFKDDGVPIRKNRANSDVIVFNEPKRK